MQVCSCNSYVWFQIKKNMANKNLISEAIDCINNYYRDIKQDAADGVAEAIPIYNDLKERFNKVGKYVRTAKNAG